MTTRLVVSGTDTGIGKTVFCAALADALGAYYWKPVQAGLNGETDSEVVRRLGRLPPGRVLPEAWRLHTPVSPHRAAEIDAVDDRARPRWSHPTRTDARFDDRGRRRAARAADAGGAFRRRFRPLDACRSFSARAPSLGTINHTLLSTRSPSPPLDPPFRRGLRGATAMPRHRADDRGDWAPRAQARQTCPRINPLDRRGFACGFCRPNSTFRTCFRKRALSRRRPFAGLAIRFAQHALEPPMRQDRRRTKARHAVHTRTGGSILDAISSWWVITHEPPAPAPSSTAIQAAADRLRPDHLRRMHARSRPRRWRAGAPAAWRRPGLADTFFIRTAARPALKSR